MESLQRLDSLSSNGLAMVVFDAEVSADGQWLALSEGRFGGAPSIWIAHCGSVDQPFEPPLRLSRLDGFVEAPALSPDEQLLYYHRRDGQRWRIYVAER